MQKKKSFTPFEAYETRSPNGNEKGYIRITKSIEESDAIRDLTDLSHRIYIDMKFVAQGHREVIYNQEKCFERQTISKGGYTACIRQLVAMGLIERKPRSNWAPSMYIFSERWKTYVSPYRDPLTGKYHKPKHKSRLINSRV